MTNLIVVIIPIIALALMANKISYSTIVDKSINNSVQNLELINQNLTSLITHAEDLGKIIVSNERVQTIVRKATGSKDLIGFEDEILIKSMLDNIIEPGASISSVVLYAQNGHILGSGKINTASIKKGIWSEYDKAIEDRIKTIRIDMHPIDYELGYEVNYGATLLKSIVNINNGSIMGKAEVNINEKNISNLYSHLKYGVNGKFIIVNNQGIIVSSANPAELNGNISKEAYFDWIQSNNQQGKVFLINNKKHLVTSSRFEPMGWTVLGFIPLSELTVDGNKVSNIILLTGLICIFLAMISSSIISKTISMPVVRLSKIMSNAGQGDLEVRAHVKGKDEIGLLSKSFNNMLEQISNLMNQVYIEQRRKREFELLAIQAQINPHFLYNTLESICSLTQLGRNDDVFKMVKSLSMFYRIALSKGKNIITIQEEIDNVRHYLTIQEVRYKDKFECYIEMDDEILDKHILKLSIQPLVENAIYHGIRNKRGKGFIHIIGKRQNDDVVISVIDNGKGFDEEELKKVLEDSTEDSNNKSFGLKSVNERIKLYFGPRYGIHLSSKNGEGAVIDIVLPMDKEGE